MSKRLIAGGAAILMAALTVGLASAVFVLAAFGLEVLEAVL